MGACPGLPRNAEVNAGNGAPGRRDNPMPHAPVAVQRAARQHREGDSGVSEHTGPRGEREGLADELAAREDRRRELAAMSKAALCRMYRAGGQDPERGCFPVGRRDVPAGAVGEKRGDFLDSRYRIPAPGNGTA